jgi:hypothetical protein
VALRRNLPERPTGHLRYLDGTQHPLRNSVWDALAAGQGDYGAHGQGREAAVNAPDVVHWAPPGEAVTVYPVIGEPPFDVG